MIGDETPQEREERLARLRIEAETARAVKRAEAKALREQPPEVQHIARLRDAINEWTEALGSNFESVFPEDEDGNPDAALPATVEARDAAMGALRRLADALSAEIASRWR